MQSSAISTSMKEMVLGAIDRIRKTHSDFEDAYETYVAQYGKDKINVNAPINLSDSIDPVALVLGSNCVIFYDDYSKTLRGDIGKLNLKQDEVYILGRRQPQDSKIVAWGEHRNVELKDYNSRVDTIPSRVHAAMVLLSEKETLFTDLGSSAGTMIVGESLHKGAFVRVYDPGTEKIPSVKFERVFTTKQIS